MLKIIVKLKAEIIFSSSDVAKHKSKETGIWVSYDGGVYDITEFVDGHPGGKFIFSFPFKREVK